jgi:hypothetical protein
VVAGRSFWGSPTGPLRVVQLVEEAEPPRFQLFMMIGTNTSKAEVYFC